MVLATSNDWSPDETTMDKASTLTIWTASLLLVTACRGGDVIPPTLNDRVERQVDFSTLKHQAADYRGRLVPLGGEVLTAKRFSDRTQIEVFQLPLKDSLEPVDDRTKSQGRFLAVQDQFLDPATLPPGTRITLVGEVMGTELLPLDDTEYEYPVLRIRHLTMWRPDDVSRSWSPFGYPWRPLYPWPAIPPPVSK